MHPATSLLSSHQGMEHPSGQDPAQLLWGAARGGLRPQWLAPELAIRGGCELMRETGNCVISMGNKLGHGELPRASSEGIGVKQGAGFT